MKTDYLLVCATTRANRASKSIVTLALPSFIRRLYGEGANIPWGQLRSLERKYRPPLFHCVEKRFRICPNQSLDDWTDQLLFAGDGVILLPVQDNDPSCSSKYCNIRSICDELLSIEDADDFERLVQLSNSQYFYNVEQRASYRRRGMSTSYYGVDSTKRRTIDYSNRSCREVSFNDWVRPLMDPTNPDRVWLYQTCAEWGFYQTCNEGSDCPFPHGLHRVQFDLMLCERLFNITSDQVYQNVNWALTLYGGRRIQSSRIMFVNGEVDPWSGLSVLDPANTHMVALSVPNTAHHFWTHPVQDTDTVYVREAREVIWRQVLTFAVLEKLPAPMLITDM